MKLNVSACWIFERLVWPLYWLELTKWTEIPLRIHLQSPSEFLLYRTQIMKRCRSLAAEVQNVLQDTVLNWLLTSISQYAFCSTPTRYLQAKQRSIDPVCSILPWFKKIYIYIYIYIYISLKVQTLSRNWKVHEKVKGNMKNKHPSSRKMYAKCQSFQTQAMSFQSNRRGAGGAYRWL